jgi:segregation and condensation protein B
MEENTTPAQGLPAEVLPDQSTQDQQLPSVSAEDLLPAQEPTPETASPAEAEIKAVLEAIIYITEEPLSKPQIANALGQPAELIDKLLAELAAEYERPEHGLTIREVAGGYKMATKAEHHEAVRAFVKSLKPPLKLSLAALETLAVIAYKQPITSPEVMEIRGVQGAGVLKTLLERKLIAAAGRKNVIGKPVLYKTTKEFLIQFGLKDVTELPSLKEFEEIRRLSIPDSEPEPQKSSEPIQEPMSEPAATIIDPLTEPPPEPAPEREPETPPEKSADSDGEV